LKGLTPMVRMAPSCDGAPLPGTSVLPRRKRITSPHFTASDPYSFSTSPATLSSAAIALAGSLKPRGVSSGRASSVGTLKPPMFWNDAPAAVMNLKNSSMPSLSTSPCRSHFASTSAPRFARTVPCAWAVATRSSTNWSAVSTRVESFHDLMFSKVIFSGAVLRMRMPRCARCVMPCGAAKPAANLVASSVAG